jgi:hypothetical protein
MSRVGAVPQVLQMRQHSVGVARLDQLQRCLAVVPGNRLVAEPDDRAVGIASKLLGGGQNADRTSAVSQFGIQKLTLDSGPSGMFGILSYGLRDGHDWPRV